MPAHGHVRISHLKLELSPQLLLVLALTLNIILCAHLGSSCCAGYLVESLPSPPLCRDTELRAYAEGISEAHARVARISGAIVQREYE